jgi:hypothetical protein
MQRIGFVFNKWNIGKNNIPAFEMANNPLNCF